MLTIKKNGGSIEYGLGLGSGASPSTLPEYHESYYFDQAPLPPRESRPRPRIGIVYWPTWGLSRFAHSAQLIAGADLYALQQESGYDGTVELRYQESASATVRTFKMHVVTAAPFVDTGASVTPAPTADDVRDWILTLVDSRYLHQQVVGTADATNASWKLTLEALINGACGTAITVTAPHADYSTPSTQWSTRKGRNLAVLADACAAAVNLRIFVATDGTVSVQTAADAVSAHGSWAATVFPDLHSGGVSNSSNAIPTSFSIIPWTTSGVGTVATGATGAAGIGGVLTAWVPHDSSGNYHTRFVTDAVAWLSATAAEAKFAGYVTPPTSALVHAWVVDYAAGTCEAVGAPGAYPFPLVGTVDTRPAPAGATIHTENSDASESGTTANLVFDLTRGAKIIQDGAGAGYDLATTLDASTTQIGVVNLSDQSFAGDKSSDTSFSAPTSGSGRVYSADTSFSSGGSGAYIYQNSVGTYNSGSVVGAWLDCASSNPTLHVQSGISGSSLRSVVLSAAFGGAAEFKWADATNDCVATLSALPPNTAAVGMVQLGLNGSFLVGGYNSTNFNYMIYRSGGGGGFFTGIDQAVGAFDSIQVYGGIITARTAYSPPTITGSKISGAALADLLSKLASAGLIIDSTSA